MATISGATFDSTTLTDFFNLTLPKIDKEVRDSFFDHNVYIKYMDQLGAIQRGQTGDGCYIQWEMDENGTVDARALSNPIDLTAPDLFRAGLENYGEYSGAIPIDHVTRAKNAGPEKLIPYLDRQRKNLSKSMNKKFNYDLMNGSGSYPALAGLTQLISTTPTTGSIHGVARSTNSWIQNQQRNANCSTTNGFGPICIHDIWTGLNLASKGMGDRSMFKLAVMDDTVYANMAYYLPDLGNSQRVTIAGNGSRNIPADQLKYAGEGTFYLGEALAIWDHQAPSDSIRWINPDYVKIRILQDCNFVTAKTHAEDSFGTAILIGLAANQVNLNPRYSFVLHTFTA